MTDAVTDTHALIWYLEDSPNLSAEAGKFFEACDNGEIFIHIPTICLVEIVYLQEKGRIPAHFGKQLNIALSYESSGFVLADLTIDIANALSKIPRSAVPDMPDRIIAATAIHLSLPLISRDKKIRLSDVKTIC